MGVLLRYHPAMSTEGWAWTVATRKVVLPARIYWISAEMKTAGLAVGVVLCECVCVCIPKYLHTYFPHNDWCVYTTLIATAFVTLRGLKRSLYFIERGPVAVTCFLTLVEPIYHFR